MIHELVLKLIISGVFEAIKLGLVKGFRKTWFQFFSIFPVFLYDAIPKFIDAQNYYLSMQATWFYATILAASTSIGGSIYAIYSSLLYVLCQRSIVDFLYP